MVDLNGDGSSREREEQRVQGNLGARESLVLLKNLSIMETSLHVKEFSSMILLP